MAIPIAEDDFNLSANNFCSGLALHNGKPLLLLSPVYNGCEVQFSVVRALDCRRAGLVVQRHNEVHDVTSGSTGL